MLDVHVGRLEMRQDEGTARTKYLNSSHITIAKAHTSDLDEKTLSSIDSIAIHLIGNFSVLVNR